MTKQKNEFIFSLIFFFFSSFFFTIILSSLFIGNFEDLLSIIVRQDGLFVKLLRIALFIGICICIYCIQVNRSKYPKKYTSILLFGILLFSSLLLISILSSPNYSGIDWVLNMYYLDNHLAINSAKEMIIDSVVFIYFITIPMLGFFYKRKLFDNYFYKTYIKEMAPSLNISIIFLFGYSIRVYDFNSAASMIDFVLSLFSIRKELKITSLSLVITLCLYLILIFIPLALGVGFESYAITKEGTLGFYNSANEISAIIAILTPILFIIFYESKNIIFKLFITFIYFVVILSVGTKTPLLALIISLCVVFVYILYKAFKDKKYHIVTTFTAIIVALSLVVIIVAPRTSFYKNIEVHLDYLKVDNIFDIFKDEKLVDHFIFSQRLTFLNNKEKIYDE